MSFTGQPLPPSVLHGDRDIRFVRELDAPRAKVFQAFADPAHVGRWWGPAGFTTTTTSIDVRTGGHWQFVMHGPDGTDWPNRLDYLEVTPVERLRWEHRGDAEQPSDFSTTVQLDELGPARTRLQFTMTCIDAATRDTKVGWGAAEGGQQTLDRLETQLANELVITRRFRASKATVWAMLSQREHLAKWWGPAGLSLHVEALDFRAGGHFHYRMGDGEHAQYGVFLFREIDAPDRLVFTNGFCDAAMNPTRAPFDGEWPLRILNTWTLDERDGITTLRLHGAPVDATDAGWKTFRHHFESMRAGFGRTFDQLQAYLATQENAR